MLILLCGIGNRYIAAAEAKHKKSQKVIVHRGLGDLHQYTN